MSPGSNCQYITGNAVGSVTFAAAIITDGHSEECVSLAVFPGLDDYGTEFSPSEISSGIARRTSVVKGTSPGNWREMPSEEPDTS